MAKLSRIVSNLVIYISRIFPYVYNKILTFQQETAPFGTEYLFYVLTNLAVFLRCEDEHHEHNASFYRRKSSMSAILPVLINQGMLFIDNTNNA